MALQYIRKRKRRRVFLFHSADEYEFERAGDDVGARYDQREVMKHLYRHLDTLSEKKRTVFVLHELEGLAFEDVAEICSIPVNTVRSHPYSGSELFAYAVQVCWRHIMVRITSGRYMRLDNEMTAEQMRPLERHGR